MSLEKGVRAAALLVTAHLMMPAVALATVFEDPRADYTLHYFTDVDGVSVASHYAGTGVGISGEALFRLQWGHDVVTFPAIEAAPGSQEAVDAITTASRPIANPADAFNDFVKIRDEVTASITWRGFLAGYYVSTESDYFAQMVTAGYNRMFFDDNLNISTLVSYGWDDITPLSDFDTAGLADYRKLFHANVIATQTLTPTTVVRAGVEYNRVRGLQHDPYRNVYVSGTNVPEEHPADRDRWDGFVRVSQYITNRSSVRADYRYYADDWGVSSHTIGARLSQYVTESVVVRYRYRYYTQAAARFFRDEYLQPGGVGGFQTGDYRLGDYGAHLMGAQVTWDPWRTIGTMGILKRTQLILSYEHYFNSNNFSANIYETGLRVMF